MSVSSIALRNGKAVSSERPIMTAVKLHGERLDPTVRSTSEIT